MNDRRAWYEGLSRAQWFILIVAWLGWVFDIFDQALFNLAKGPMLKQMLGADQPRIGTQIEGWIQAVFLIGWAIGGLIFGILADRWGRTRTLVLTVLIYCVFTGLTALCTNPTQVGIVRFVTALGIGGEWAAGAALVAESLPDRARAGAASFIQSAAAVGPMLAALANLFLKSAPWQFLFLVGVIPAALCVAVRLGVNEPDRAKRAIDTPHSPIQEIFANRETRRNVIVAMIIGVVGIIGAGTATYWAPNLVDAVSVGMSSADIAARKSYMTIFPHIGTLLGVFVVPWLCQRFGRKPTILTFFIAAPIVLVISMLNPTYAGLLVFMPLLYFFTIGVSAAYVLYFPELFPTRMRATGAGLAYNVARLISVPVPIITGFLVHQVGGRIGVAIILTGSIYLLGIAAIPFAPETKGKPLPE